MLNAQLISLSRQTALQRQMDVVANNMANVNTTGFKAETMLFGAYDGSKATAENMPWADQALAYTESWGTLHQLQQGGISQTGNPLDVALDGKGFLAVQTPNGERYTRDGALQINAQGFLVDTAGNQVLAEGGPIQFSPGETDITIAKDGSISTSAGAKGRLKVVEFANPQQLTRQGNNLFAGTGAQPATGTAVVQGAIERSNVSGVTEMAEMIRVTRAYETLSKIMQHQSDLSQTAIDKLGTVSA